jgi:hypothetical protein
MDSSQISEARVADMKAGVAKYLREERALYHRASEPLAANWKTAVQSYFPKSLLDTVRTVTLEGAHPATAVLRRSGGHEFRHVSGFRASRFRHLH